MARCSARELIVYAMAAGLCVYLFLLGFVFPSNPDASSSEGADISVGEASGHRDIGGTVDGQVHASALRGDNAQAPAHHSDIPSETAIDTSSRNSAVQATLKHRHDERLPTSLIRTTRTQVSHEESSDEYANDGTYRYFDRRTNSWQECPHLFYLMPDEFQQDGVMSIWSKHTYAALKKAPCRTRNFDEAAVIVPGIETACPVNWPHFANHREFQRNYVFINASDNRKCHETLPERFQMYWERHDFDALTRSAPSNTEETASVEHGGRGRGQAGKFVAMFRSGGFPVAWIENGPYNKQIILAHSSRTVTNTAESLFVSYPVMPLTLPADPDEVGRDPCRPRPIFASFQGSRTWKTREKLLAYNELPDVRINLKENTRQVNAVGGLDGQENATADEYQQDYLKLLHDSVFTFVVRGHNHFSFRFPEAIASGSIPVILSDRWHLPFQGAPAVNYSDFSFVFPEAEADTLMSKLRAVSPERICEMQRNLRRVYKDHFESFQSQVDTYVTVVNDLVDKRDAWTADRAKRKQKKKRR